MIQLTPVTRTIMLLTVRSFQVSLAASKELRESSVVSAIGWSIGGLYREKVWKSYRYFNLLQCSPLYDLWTLNMHACRNFHQHHWQISSVRPIPQTCKPCHSVISLIGRHLQSIMNPQCLWYHSRRLRFALNLMFLIYVHRLCGGVG